MFGRRKRSQDVPGPAADPEEFVDDLDPEHRAAEDAQLQAELDARAAQQARTEPPHRPRGPWDVADVPAEPEVPRLDLGGLRLPIPPDTEVRVDVGPEGDIIAATLVQGESALQISAFAAPRSSGIWEEVRTEIAQSLQETGGSAQEAPGPYGVELQATVPTAVEGHGIVMLPVRFLGVDGPRWFLRGLLTGPAAVSPEPAAPLEQAMREVVVVRGTDPMAVRDALPLTLPREVQAAATAEPNPLGLPERGPEITELR